MMERMPLIRIEKTVSCAAFQVFIVSEDYDYICEDIVMKEKHQYSPGQACMKLHNTQAQVLMDDLWNCGIRPTEGSGSAGSLMATQAHLKDIQGIADKTLNKILNIK